MTLPVFLILLAIGFYFWYDTPCPDICDIRVEPIILPAEKEEFTDPETGAKVVRLTTDPSNDDFDYYEPTHWSPDDKRLKFVTTRFRDKLEDPVLHMIGTIDIETGRIVIYKTKYSIRWSEWSRDGRYIYGVALFKDRKLEPYFIAVDTEDDTGRVLRLRYKIGDLPDGFDEKVGAVKDPKMAVNKWLIKGEHRIPYEALFFHLNPSGTLGGFEAYGSFGVIDLRNWKTWIVDTGTNRGAFFDDRTAMISPLPVNAPYSETPAFYPSLVDVFTGERKTFPPGPSICNHGNIFYEDNELAKIICPGRIPDTPEGKETLYIYDVRSKTIDLLSQMPEPECCGAPATISSDGRRVAGLSLKGITVYDAETKKKAVPLSGSFFDKYIAGGSAVGASYGGQLMISHDGQRVAFVSGLYESKERLEEAAELELVCEELENLKKWAEEEHRTAEERQRVTEKLNRSETIELEKKCEEMKKYTPDIFVVYLEDEFFK